MKFFGKKKTVTSVQMQTTTTTTTTTATTMNDSERKQAAAAAPTLGLHDIPRKEGEKRIYNLIILDESGSMQSIYNQALSGANETITTIRNAQKDDDSLSQFLTFVTFDQGRSRPDVRAIINCAPISEVKDMTKNDYRPKGCTPLYDAMGISIRDLSAVVKDVDNVLVTIITDGYENSSRFYSASMVKELVESLRAKGWVFTYIGANQDSVEVAGELGIHNSMDFRQDEEGTRMMWEKMNSGRRVYYRKASRMNMTGIMENLEDDFFAMKRGLNRITPDRVGHLAQNEVIVKGDAAHCGLAGCEYLIPTIGVSLEQIRSSVREFIYFAEGHQEMKFYVSKVGCGHAGFTPEQIAPLFAGAYSLPNVSLPASFWRVLDYKYNR